MTEKSIPLLDLTRQYSGIRSELMNAVQKVAAAQSFVLGPTVAEFERAVAEYIGVPFAVGVGSGTDALFLALRALDLAPGDEVITTPFSFFATAGAIQNAGGRTVFVDIDPATFNLDADAVGQAVTDRTRAILPVHLFGQMADMEPLLDLADAHDLTVIEDAAQTIGGTARVRDDRRNAGSLGRMGCFSFYPTKNLGGWGDGGLVCTHDPDFDDRLRRLRVHGRDPSKSYYHPEVGINSRLDALQAAVLNVKLPHLDGWTEVRRQHAAAYDRDLAEVTEVTTPVNRSDRFHVYHQYTLRAERRDELRSFLAEQRIGTGVYYPLPLHLQPCFSHLGYEQGDFPNAERAAEEVLSLPVFPELTAEERDRVVAAITEFYGV